MPPPSREVSQPTCLRSGDGGRDAEYLKLYRRALLNVRTVIGVVAKNDEGRKQAKKLLKAGGARLNYIFWALCHRDLGSVVRVILEITFPTPIFP